MPLTPSNMIPIGTKAPNFSLPNPITGKIVSLDELKSEKATVIMFICNHCPFVQYIIKNLVAVTEEYQKKGVAFIAISSNDIINFPEDAPEKMKETAAKFRFTFPYLFDESQEVAKAYQAACTPDFFIFDKNLACVYRGRFDESSPSKEEVPITGKDLTDALDKLLANQPIEPDQKPSIGCNIKWKEEA